MGAPAALDVRRRGHVGGPVDCRRYWNCKARRHDGQQSTGGVCLHLHLFLCVLVGAVCLGGDWYVYCCSPSEVLFVLSSFPSEPKAHAALNHKLAETVIPFLCTTGEIFPLKARAKGLSMTTASNWLLNWAIAYATPYIVNNGPGDA